MLAQIGGKNASIQVKMPSSREMLGFIQAWLLASPNFPRWRPLGDNEDFECNYLPNQGNRRGYVVEIEVVPQGHVTCGCMRSHTPQKILWFLPHSDQYMGLYPMHRPQHEEFWLSLLRDQVQILGPSGSIVRFGPASYDSAASFERIVRLGPRMSYGARLGVMPAADAATPLRLEFFGGFEIF